MSKTLLSLAIMLIAAFQLVSSQQINHWETAIFNDDTWRYFPGLSEPPATWRSAGFNDTQWAQGKGGFGYEDDDDNTLIPACTSVYLRIKFTVSDTSKISLGVLHMDYDDAFVAYLNDVEIARSGITGQYPAYTSLGANHDARMPSGGLPESFLLPKASLVKSLKQGVNVLAIQVHQSSVNSSDMSSNAWLSFGIRNKTRYFRSTPYWFYPPDTQVPFSTSLPLIVIDTQGQTIPDEPKINGRMKIIFREGELNTLTDSANVYDGWIGIERRGASSYNYPQRPYALETRDDTLGNLNVSLLGMPKENDWVLLSNYNDKSLVRNILAHELFRRMGHYAPRMRLAEVYVNGSYEGIYLFGEKIKENKNRVNISTLRPEDNDGDQLSGGYIFKTDYTGYNDYWTSNYSPVNRPGGRVNFVYYEPKVEELTSAQKKYIQAYVDTLEGALYGPSFDNQLSGYRNFIDVHSFVDYFIIGELSRNVDAYKKSRFFHKTRTSKSKLVYSGPTWDFDWAWKNLNDCYLLRNIEGAGWAYRINECNVSPVPPSWEVKMLEDPYFSNTLHSRYFQLRKSLLSMESMIGIIDSVAALVNEAQARHFAKFQLMGTSGPAPEIDAPSTTYAGELAKLKYWISTRVSWLDDNMPGTAFTGVLPVQEEVQLLLFPNPVQETLYIESEENIESVLIYSLAGAEVIRLRPASDVVAIPVQALPAGQYLVRMVTGSGLTLSRKIEKR